MGFESLSVYNANPFFQSAVAAGITDSPVFGMKLTASGAELTLGADDEQYAGGLQYTPVTQQVYFFRGRGTSFLLNFNLGLLAG